MATDTLSGRLQKLVGAEVQAALAALEAARAEPYYDEAADRSARERYYDALDATDGEPCARPWPSASNGPMTRVRPTGRCSGSTRGWTCIPTACFAASTRAKPFSPEELIQADAAVERARTERMLEFNLRETALGPSELRAEAAAIEEALPYNCEHVVCQSWFDEDEPMRGDIHHLFACESGCNSFRGNFPYVDFPDTQEIVRDACGRREDDGFEPGGGKGPVARATLYFLLRYPGLIGDGERELTPDRLTMVLAWHEEDPVSDYERHRNYAIAELQGNRNPMIDHPDWASRIDFAAAWA